MYLRWLLIVVAVSLAIYFFSNDGNENQARQQASLKDKAPSQSALVEPIINQAEYAREHTRNNKAKHEYTSKTNQSVSQLVAVDEGSQHAKHDHDTHSHDRDDLDQKKLELLLNKHMTNAMRDDINNALLPDGKPPVASVIDGYAHLDTSDRYASVTVAIIDDAEGVVITDFTQPLTQGVGGAQQTLQSQAAEEP